MLLLPAYSSRVETCVCGACGGQDSAQRESVAVDGREPVELLWTSSSEFFRIVEEEKKKLTRGKVELADEVSFTRFMYSIHARRACRLK